MQMENLNYKALSHYFVTDTVKLKKFEYELFIFAELQQNL